MYIIKRIYDKQMIHNQKTINYIFDQEHIDDLWIKLKQTWRIRIDSDRNIEEKESTRSDVKGFELGDWGNEKP